VLARVLRIPGAVRICGLHIRHKGFTTRAGPDKYAAQEVVVVQ
jgi:hypothetical protein